MIGFAYKVLSRTNIHFDGIKNIYLALVVIGSFSIGYNVLYKQITFEGITYTENIKQLKKKYSTIERGSSIIFGERQIDYLRTDLVPLKPYYLPLFAEIESLGDFNKRISKSNSIFFSFTSTIGPVHPIPDSA